MKKERKKERKKKNLEKKKKKKFTNPNIQTIHENSSTPGEIFEDNSKN